MDATAKVARLADAEPVSFGPLAEYRKLTGDDGLPVFTGVQTCRPGIRRRCIRILTSNTCSCLKARPRPGWMERRIARRG